MESIIRKKIKHSDLKNIFDNYFDVVNIKDFIITNRENEWKLLSNIPTFFNIRIRHKENENPKDLFNKAIKQIS